MSLFQNTMPIKPVKDKHQGKKRTVLYSRDWCDKCNKMVYMVWVVYGIKKRCTERGCGKEYAGWKCMPEDNPLTNT